MIAKNTFLLFFSAFLCLGFFSCWEDDDSDENATLPQTASDYIANNYSDYDVDETELEELCSGEDAYKVELENADNDEMELVFDMEGSFLYAVTEISNSALPESVRNSISTNYPDYTLDDAERHDRFDDTVEYQVEIEKGRKELYVILNTEGTVLCEVEDD